MFSAEEKASVLIEALPYIQQFYGKTVVVKYGGNAMVSDTLKEKVMEDIALLKYVGVRPVIIHGGGPEITGFLKKVGKQTSFVSGLRVTDEETVEIAEMVLDGKVNSEIVNLLNHRGVRAVGYAGVPMDPEKTVVSFGGIPVYAHGVGAQTDTEKIAKVMAEHDITIDIDLADGDSEATVWTCDFSYEYVKINGEYHT